MSTLSGILEMFVTILTSHLWMIYDANLQMGNTLKSGLLSDSTAHLFLTLFIFQQIKPTSVVENVFVDGGLCRKPHVWEV